VLLVGGVDVLVSTGGVLSVSVGVTIGVLVPAPSSVIGVLVPVSVGEVEVLVSVGGVDVPLLVWGLLPEVGLVCAEAESVDCRRRSWSILSFVRQVLSVEVPIQISFVTKMFLISPI